MMDRKDSRRIIEFIKSKPRTVQEVAELLKRNWRTADRYVEQVAKDTGSLSTRTFREGTRGALKIVYFNTKESIGSTELQEKLLKKMENRRKNEFSPFDIYQYVPDKKSALIMEGSSKAFMRKHLESSGGQVLSFSGNLSWINSEEGRMKLLKVVESLTRREVSIKVLCRVTIDSINNVKSLLLLNDKVGKNMIEIRHFEQPLRGFVIDSSIARFREMRDPSDYEKGEIDKRITLFYEVFDSEWIEWLQKVFWHFFRTSIPAEKRIRDLESIRNAYSV